MPPNPQRRPPRASSKSKRFRAANPSDAVRGGAPGEHPGRVRDRPDRRHRAGSPAAARRQPAVTVDGDVRMKQIETDRPIGGAYGVVMLLVVTPPEHITGRSLKALIAGG